MLVEKGKNVLYYYLTMLKDIQFKEICLRYRRTYE